MYMTTLIIHPNKTIQTEKAFELVQKILGKKVRSTQECPDLQILDGKGVLSIGIDEIRKFKKKLQFEPYESEKQIGLILHASALTLQAQNSLLKILEEPGENTIFILTVSNERALLPTILSRSQKIYIKEGIDKQPEAVFKDVDSKFLTKIKPGNFFNASIEDRFLIVEELVELNKENPNLIDWFLKQILDKYREDLMISLREKGENREKDEDLNKISNSVNKIKETINYISHNVNKRLALENLILQLEESIM
jgi:DNA polymerase-3 subunit delta'